jgi:hypothetical protein
LLGWIRFGSGRRGIPEGEEGLREGEREEGRRRERGRVKGEAKGGRG